MAHTIGTAPRVRYTIYGGLVVGTIVVVGLSAFRLIKIPSTEFSSNEMIFLVVGSLIVGVKALSTFFKKSDPWTATTQILWWGGLILLLWWVIWGSGGNLIKGRVATGGQQVRHIVVPLHSTQWSDPVPIPPCTGWMPYPEPGKSIEVTAADDGMKKIYHYTPTETPNVPGRGPFYFRSKDGGYARVEFLEPGTHCYRTAKYMRNG